MMAGIGIARRDRTSIIKELGNDDKEWRQEYGFSGEHL
jgi:hypothetical protein